MSEPTLPPSTSQHTLSLDTLPNQSPPPPEIESTLSRLSAYRNVRGVMILSRSSSASIQATNGSSSENSGGAGVGGIIQTTGNIFEGESGTKYAKAVEEIVLRVGKALNDCEPGDELKFMRIRTKKHELIITPDEKYLLVVLQDPGQS
ncbi:dynein light chain roadblock-type [Kwoniella mangroviensis CBS 8886]|nr:dynein light chain roadblock-type [Kwoniella mangroviensis CBS 8886]